MKKIKALLPLIFLLVIGVAFVTMNMSKIRDPYSGLLPPSTMVDGAALPADYNTPVPTAEAPVTVGPPIIIMPICFSAALLGGLTFHVLSRQVKKKEKEGK